MNSILKLGVAKLQGIPSIIADRFLRSQLSLPVHWTLFRKIRKFTACF